MMKTTKKKIITRSEDKFGEKSFEIVLSDYNYNFEKKEYCYSYESKLGRCILTISKDNICIVRKDKFENKINISFDGKKNLFLYQSEYLKENFYVMGKSLTYSFDNEKRIINFSYSLFDKNDFELNEINFSIREL